MEKKNSEISKKSKEEQEAINIKRMANIQRGALNQAQMFSPFTSQFLPQPSPFMAPTIYAQPIVAPYYAPPPQQVQINQSRGYVPNQQNMGMGMGMPMAPMPAYNPFGFQSYGMPNYGQQFAQPYGQQYGGYGFGGYRPF